MRWVACVLGLAVAATAVRASDLPARSSIAGFVRYESNKWLFRACSGRGTSAALRGPGMPFIDASPDGLLFAAIQQRWQQSADPARGVFVEIAGYVEGGRLTVTRLDRALGWVASCAERPLNIPDDARAWAAGHEPSWAFVLDSRAATWRTPDGVMTLPAGQWRTEGSSAVYDASVPGGRVRVEFTDALCSDTMAEAAFGRRVVAAFNGAIYAGCGLVR
jgi:uncharacterized membrane protein